MITFVAECPGCSQNIINTNPLVLQRVPVLRTVLQLESVSAPDGSPLYNFAYHCIPDRPVECSYSEDVVPADFVRMLLAEARP